ncbi:hypothetical protein D0962_28500 [Leptolyngbyaceae cyanobacterium CCMR0082]|uniref:Uncharacterized protein n=1 Tax=Adonisia turfae CCMR0082 TaxID=2304604 RepID=A0A6M0SDY1_9CYAN|nr:hypothetical protein [Adonisia turfae]NEZ66654.1 hypothetical protein [Adonisia turfae CCMR0082]
MASIATDEILIPLATQLRDEIGDLLGQFSDGEPAFTVEPPEDVRRNSVTGLFCGIDRFPMGSSDRVSGGAHKNGYTRVTLVNYDRQSVNLVEAANRIEATFNQFRPSIHSPSSDDVYEQIVFSLYSPYFLIRS